ncbi:MAG: hypothetical protein DRG78_02595 [Epsilonproteobacteria bacterium]|nr:MAG: hypothetical protein DRG78_02595 [Campylobacterota bacterium]
MKRIILLLIVPILLLSNNKIIMEKRKTIVTIFTEEAGKTKLVAGVKFGTNKLITCAHSFLNKHDNFAIIDTLVPDSIPKSIDKPKILAINYKKDIAIILVPGANWKNSSKLSKLKFTKDDLIYAIGSPIGKQGGLITVGKFIKENSWRLHSDVLIDHGNSGGAILDKNGDLIAISNKTIILKATRENLGTYATKISSIYKVME